MQNKGHQPTPHTFIKINSKWIIDLYIKPKIIQHLEENIGGNPGDPALGKEFLDTIIKAQSTKEKT